MREHTNNEAEYILQLENLRLRDKVVLTDQLVVYVVINEPEQQIHLVDDYHDDLVHLLTQPLDLSQERLQEHEASG